MPAGGGTPSATEQAGGARTVRLGSLGAVTPLEIESDDEAETQNISPASISPRSLKKLQDTAKGVPGVDPNASSGAGGMW